MSNNNNSSSKILTTIIYIFVILIVLGVAISAIKSITDNSNSNTSDSSVSSNITGYDGNASSSDTESDTNSSTSSDESSSSGTSSDDDTTKAQYSITWGYGTLPDGYSFYHECPSSATAGDTVTISISDTISTGSNDVIQFYVKDTDSGEQLVPTEIITFTTTTWTFTMPEYNVTITYIVYDAATSVVT